MNVSPSGSGNRVRKGVECPKPLKSASILQQHTFRHPADPAGALEVLELYGKVAKDLSAKTYGSEVVAKIVSLNHGLKVHGIRLEQTHKEVLDRYQAFLRNACRDGTLDLVARLQLLEIIELRAVKWKPNENVTNYYKHKLLQVEQCDVMYNHSSSDGKSKRELNANASEFQPCSSANYCASATANLSSLLAVQPKHAASASQGQTITSTGKPVKIPGKDQLKDEVVIRNADSGKVEIGAKERQVQIIGPNETQIDVAKGLMEKTIERNQTPELIGNNNNNNDPELLSKMAKATGTYSYTVEVGNDSIKILGANPNLVREAKIILDYHFSVKNDDDDKTEETDSMASEQGPIIGYDRRQLLGLSNSPFCHQEPQNWSSEWEALKLENPGLARNVKTESGQVGESGDYFKPKPELFMTRMATFPDGFVRKFPNFHDNQKPRMSCLDKLFTETASGDGHHHPASSLQLLLDNASVWDDARQEWVKESTLNTRT